MKNLPFGRRLLLLACFISVLLLVAGCKKDDDKPKNTSIREVTIQLSGAAEVPPVTQAGSGSIKVKYDTTTNIISYDLTWQLGSTSATTTGMHFHGDENGSPTTNSPVQIGVTGFNTGASGTVSGSTVALTPVQENQLLAGKWYFNIHSSNFPSGEIRGNIIFPAQGSSNNTDNNNNPY